MARRMRRKRFSEDGMGSDENSTVTRRNDDADNDIDNDFDDDLDEDPDAEDIDDDLTEEDIAIAEFEAKTGPIDDDDDSGEDADALEEEEDEPHSAEPDDDSSEDEEPRRRRRAIEKKPRKARKNTKKATWSVFEVTTVGDLYEGKDLEDTSVEVRVAVGEDFVSSAEAQRWIRSKADVLKDKTVEIVSVKDRFQLKAKYIVDLVRD